MKKIILFLYCLLSCGCQVYFSQFQSLEEEKIKRLIEEAQKGDYSIIEPEDLTGVPQSVSDYYTHIGLVGQNRKRVAFIIQEGALKLTPDGEWLNGYAEEYLTIPNLSRNWISEIGLNNLLNAYTHEYYIDGKGLNRVQFFPSMSTMTSTGVEIDVSAFITLVSDLVLCPTAFAGENIHWSEIDESHTILRVDDITHNISTNVICSFENNLITRIESSNRYRSTDNGNIITPWRVDYSDYKYKGGILIPHHITYTWMIDDDNEFKYATLRIKDITYDEF